MGAPVSWRRYLDPREAGFLSLGLADVSVPLASLHRQLPPFSLLWGLGSQFWAGRDLTPFSQHNRGVA